MSEWQPIETAPKGEGVLLLFGIIDPCEMLNWHKPVQFVGYWDHIDGAWCTMATTFNGPFAQPTHWQPLPPPPETSA